MGKQHRTADRVFAAPCSSPSPGEPAAMGYCHCGSCREWSAGPFNAFTLWKPAAVRITRGADKIGAYHRTTRSSQVVQDFAAGIS